jgi:hypothetical protein
MDDVSQVVERQRVCVWMYKILSQDFMSSVSVTLTLLSPAVVNIKTLKGRFISHKFCTVWALGVVKSVEKKKSVVDQFAVKYKPETYDWTQKLNNEDVQKITGLTSTEYFWLLEISKHCREAINTVALT